MSVKAAVGEVLIDVGRVKADVLRMAKRTEKLTHSANQRV